MMDRGFQALGGFIPRQSASSHQNSNGFSSGALFCFEFCLSFSADLGFLQTFLRMYNEMKKQSSNKLYPTPSCGARGLLPKTQPSGQTRSEDPIFA